MKVTLISLFLYCYQWARQIGQKRNLIEVSGPSTLLNFAPYRPFFGDIGGTRLFWNFKPRKVNMSSQLQTCSFHMSFVFFSHFKATRVERIPKFNNFRSEWYWWELLRWCPFTKHNSSFGKFTFLSFWSFWCLPLKKIVVALYSS